jgi:hypothetical protein
MIARFSPADQGYMNTAQVVELILENQDTIQDLSIAVE